MRRVLFLSSMAMLVGMPVYRCEEVGRIMGRRLAMVAEKLRRRIGGRRRRRRRSVEEQLSPTELAGVQSGELCVLKSRAGGKPRTMPRGGVVVWREAWVSVEGMECEVRGPQVCCRPTVARLAHLREAHPAFMRMLERFAASAGGSPRSFRCLPSLLIAGAQKCGSTALTGLLMHHPSVRFGLQKELHYFDKNESQCTGALPYLAQFPEASRDSATAESTPFYLADPLACARIEAQVPHAKLVVLVREPVSRARSEYEMKNRRVEAQDNFAEALGDPRTSASLLKCFVSAGPRNVSAGLVACAPDRLRTNAKFQLFRNAVLKQLRAARIGRESDFVAYLRKCFVQASASEYPLDAAVSEMIFNTEEQPTSVRFDVAKCFAVGRRERVLGDIGSVLMHEIDGLEACADRNFAWRSPPTPAAAADLIDACVTVHTGISIQYVYRGLYAAQLARCGRSLDLAKILVIESDELRHSPQAQLDKVADHAGLHRFSYDQRLFETAHLQQAIRDKYPTFENSGWQLSTTYREPLPATLVAHLKSFFRPHNYLLFDLIGRSFPHWD